MLKEASEPSRSVVSCYLQLFGRPILTAAGGKSVALPRKGFALAAYLLAGQFDRVHRSDAAAFLWEDIDVERRSGNLRQLLSRLRTIQDRYDLPLFVIEGQHIAFANDDLESDVTAFRRAAGLGTKQSIVALCDAYGGPLLERYDEGGEKAMVWLRQQRARFSEEFTAALLTFVESGEAADAPEIAILASERLLEIQPAQEVAYRALMRAHAVNGELGMVRQIFARLERILRTESGSKPTVATRELYEAIISGEMKAHRTASEPDPVAPAVTSTRFLPRLMFNLPGVGAALPGKIADLADDIGLNLLRTRSLALVAPGELRSRGPVDGEVDYVLDIRARRSTPDMVSLRLSSLTSGEIVWANVYDVGDNQPWPAETIVRVVVEQVETNELVLVDQATAKVAARRQAIQGQRLLLQLDIEAIRRARNIMKGALATDPDCIPALAGLARSLSQEGVLRGRSEPLLLDEAESLARRIQRIDPDDYRGYQELGTAGLYARRFDVALELLGIARRANPADRGIALDLADAFGSACRPRDALAIVAENRLTMPHVSDIERWVAASSHYMLEDYRNCIFEVEAMGNPVPAQRLSAAAYAMLGEKEIAARLRQATLEHNPDFSVRDWLTAVPIALEEQLQHYEDGLLVAGFI